MRLADVTRDPRFGQNAALPRLPAGHLPVRSYLAVPVMGLGREVLGGLFFGHSSPASSPRSTSVWPLGIAAWARVALENARLYVEAREASRMKDEFLAVLSHELRTPLNAIVGYTRLLRGGLLKGDKAVRGFEALDRNSTWLTQIVEDVLDVSRIVSGKLRLDVQPVDLPLVVHNAMATVQPAADAKGVRLQTIVDPRVGPVAGDRDRLQQVVWNLLSNAVKFTPRAGRVQLRARARRFARRDRGRRHWHRHRPGVSAAHLRTVQSGGKPDHPPDAAGSASGLAIVRHIVELHGGTVEAFSAGRRSGIRPFACVCPP